MANDKNTQQAIELVTALADEVVQGLGMNLVEIHFGQAGRQKSLEIIIYRPQGKVGLSDCEAVSRELDARLEKLQDQVSFFHGPYVLDVASPGADRVLKSPREYAMFSGRSVEVKTKANTSESSLGQHFLATLQKLDGDDLHLTDAKPAPQGNTPKNKQKNSGKKAQEAALIKNLTVSFKTVLQVRLHMDLSKLKNMDEPAIDLSAPAACETGAESEDLSDENENN